MTKGINLGRLSLTDLVCTDSYSLYERTSFRKHSEFNEAGKSFKTPLEKYNADRNNKGHLKSSLPPLRQKRDNHKLLPFVTERHTCEHSVFETKPGDYMENKQEIIAPTLSESRKKLALSLSFVGIYDLDEMDAERTGKGKENKRLNTFKINQDQGFETLDESEGTSHKVSPVAAKFDRERTKTYVIKTLTLEDESPLSQQTLIQDKLILPEIKEPTKVRNDRIDTEEKRDCTITRLNRSVALFCTMAKLSHLNVLFQEVQAFKRKSSLNISESKTRRPPFFLPKLNITKTSTEAGKFHKADLELDVRGLERKALQGDEVLSKTGIQSKKKTRWTTKNKVNKLSSPGNKMLDQESRDPSLPLLYSKSLTPTLSKEKNASFSNPKKLPVHELEFALTTLLKVIERSKEQKKTTKEKFERSVVKGEQKPINEKTRLVEKPRTGLSSECSI
ncbi:unnamed protein product [Porites evermanni]|uniref:Uncharacterized protein n=1 Tax=Porites evermanni TaxID=104178 RepID=A0ABN8RMP0_9CNID|nr:unnamed protein product [Porites evermanni]